MKVTPDFPQRPMKCPLCLECRSHPKNPNLCEFGGPFTGYTDAKGRPITLPPKEDL